MNPDPVKNHSEFSTAIEQWGDKYRNIVEDKNEEGLPEQYRMAALRRMLTCDIKRHVDVESSGISSYYHPIEGSRGIERMTQWK